MEESKREKVKMEIQNITDSDGIISGEMSLTKQFFGHGK
jgi:hypothetical protein